MKEARPKAVVWFGSCEISSIRKSEPEGGGCPRAAERRMGDKASFSGCENVWEPARWPQIKETLHNFVHPLYATEFFAVKWLILCYVNFKEELCSSKLSGVFIGGSAFVILRSSVLFFKVNCRFTSFPSDILLLCQDPIQNSMLHFILESVLVCPGFFFCLCGTHQLLAS